MTKSAIDLVTFSEKKSLMENFCVRKNFLCSVIFDEAKQRFTYQQEID